MSIESRIKRLEQDTGLVDSLPRPPGYLDVRIVSGIHEPPGKVLRIWPNHDRPNQEFTSEEYTKLKAEENAD